MDVAIRVSVIISSLVSVLAEGELGFFNTKVFSPEAMPSNVGDVLTVALETKADGLTAPACVVNDLLESRRKVSFLIFVVPSQHSRD